MPGSRTFSMTPALAIMPGVLLWREYFSAAAQKALLGDVLARLQETPLYRPVMPKTAKPFSVEECNFGPLGWVADKSGYRYQPLHPVTQTPWPAIPPALLALWDHVAAAAPPQCCLLNLYRKGARMGMHQDRDEKDLAAPVVGVSLGDDAVFRIGSAVRGGKTHSFRLGSGGGRISLTLRRVTA